MSHLPFVATAYFFNAAAVLIDKFLITKKIPSPLTYVFYFSCFSLLALLLLPFTIVPGSFTFILASLSTLLWTTGAYFMLSTLQIAPAQRAIPIIGTLVPLILFIQALINQELSSPQILAILVLISGLVLLILPDVGLFNPRAKLNFTKREVFLSLASSIFFAISYLFLRQAYLREDFLTVFAWSRLILIPVGIILLIVPKFRKIIFAQNSEGIRFNLISKSGFIFLIGQAAGGTSELLLTFSISLATPALVNSLQGVQYIFLFLATLFLAKKFPSVFQEKFKFINLISKIGGILLIALGLYLLAFTGS